MLSAKAGELLLEALRGAGYTASGNGLTILLDNCVPAKYPENEKRQLSKLDGLAHCYSSLFAIDLHLADAAGFISG